MKRFFFGGGILIAVLCLCVFIGWKTLSVSDQRFIYLYSLGDNVKVIYQVREGITYPNIEWRPHYYSKIEKHVIYSPLEKRIIFELDSPFPENSNTSIKTFRLTFPQESYIEIKKNTKDSKLASIKLKEATLISFNPQFLKKYTQIFAYDPQTESIFYKKNYQTNAKTNEIPRGVLLFYKESLQTGEIELLFRVLQPDFGEYSWFENGNIYTIVNSDSSDFYIFKNGGEWKAFKFPFKAEHVQFLFHKGKLYVHCLTSSSIFELDYKDEKLKKIMNWKKSLLGRIVLEGCDKTFKLERSLKFPIFSKKYFEKVKNSYFLRKLNLYE